MSDRAYRVLMVCTGNICRSPMMERLLAARLRDQIGTHDAARFDLSSAGTRAMIGEPIAPKAAEILDSLGADSTGFAARDLSVEMIRDADLIVTATREHRRLVVTSEPGAASRALTLREFARLLAPVTRAEILARPARGDPVERTTSIVAAALAQRGLGPTGDAADDDIADPYKRNKRAYERAAREIDAALTVVVELLTEV